MDTKSIRALRRPFSNSHWSLFVVLVVLWVLLLMPRPWSEQQDFLQSTLPIATVLIALWTSHLRASPVFTWRDVVAIICGAIYDFVLLILLAVLVAVPFMVGQYENYPHLRVLHLIGSTDSLRAEINGRITNRKSVNGVGAGLQIGVSDGKEWGIVTNDGGIIIATESPPTVVVLQPNFLNGEVVWKFSCFPAIDHLPASCRYP